MFWSDPIEEKSFSLLLQLNKNYEFVLIGGWAVFLYTKAIKSKDIDIVVDYDELSRMMGSLPIKKNARLRKYETTIRGISVDVYLPHYSNLIFEDLMETVIEGFRVPKLEILLALKQQAELERGASLKGVKDRVDILSILLTDLDIGEYAKLVEPRYIERLREIVVEARDEFKYLGFKNLREIKKRRGEILKKLDGLRS
jgi:hypothetical protein